jgi:putative endonuclease
MYYLYILRSKTTGRLYTGTTDDIARRIRDHHLGNTASTKGRGPWELVYLEEHPDRATALQRERQLKSLEGGSEKFRLVATATEEQRQRWRAESFLLAD